MVKDKFEVLDERREPIGGDVPGTVEQLEFATPAGRMRFTWTDEPLKVGTKAFAAKRIGSEAHVVHQYSDTERLHRFTAYRWDGRSESWIELRGADGLAGFGA